MLDTHVAIWALSRPELLPSRIEALLSDADNELHVSTASIWELSIKASLGRKSAPDISATALAERSAEAGYGILPIMPKHALEVLHLPLLHGDPFDRMLVAQARIEPMILVTHDSLVACYDPNFLTW